MADEIRRLRKSGNGESLLSLTTTQRQQLNITPTDGGSVVYDKTLHKLMVYDGTSWVELGEGETEEKELLPKPYYLPQKFYYENEGVVFDKLYKGIEHFEMSGKHTIDDTWEMDSFATCTLHNDEILIMYDQAIGVNTFRIVDVNKQTVIREEYTPHELTHTLSKKSVIMLEDGNILFAYENSTTSELRFFIMDTEGNSIVIPQVITADFDSGSFHDIEISLVDSGFVFGVLTSGGNINLVRYSFDGTSVVREDESTNSSEDFYYISTSVKTNGNILLISAFSDASNHIVFCQEIDPVSLVSGPQMQISSNMIDIDGNRPLTCKSATLRNGNTAIGAYRLHTSVELKHPTVRTIIDIFVIDIELKVIQVINNSSEITNHLGYPSDYNLSSKPSILEGKDSSFNIIIGGKLHISIGTVNHDAELVFSKYYSTESNGSIINAYNAIKTMNGDICLIHKATDATHKWIGLDMFHFDNLLEDSLKTVIVETIMYSLYLNPLLHKNIICEASIEGQLYLNDLGYPEDINTSPIYFIKVTPDSSSNVAIASGGYSQTIDGLWSLTLAPGESVNLMEYKNNWITFNKTLEVVEAEDTGVDGAEYQKTVLTVTTPGSTPTNMVMCAGATASMTLEKNETIRFTCDLVARNIVYPSNISYTIKGMAFNDAGSSSIEWVDIVREISTHTYMDVCDVNVVIAAHEIKIEVTGNPTNTIKWVATIHMTKVKDI